MIFVARNDDPILGKYKEVLPAISTNSGYKKKNTRLMYTQINKQ